MIMEKVLTGRFNSFTLKYLPVNVRAFVDLNSTQKFEMNFKQNTHVHNKA